MAIGEDQYLYGFILILVVLLALSLVFLTAYDKTPIMPKKGGNGFPRSEDKKWPYLNKPYKKSIMPVVDYDLPALYEEMRLRDPWGAWPNIFL